MFDYWEHIGEEYLKKRKLLKYYDTDVAKTTKYLDLDDELKLLRMHEICAWQKALDLKDAKDAKMKEFFLALNDDLREEYVDVHGEWGDTGI